MALPRTPLVLYPNPVPPKPSRFNESETRIADTNTQGNNRPVTQLDRDNRGVQNDVQATGFVSGDSGQNTWGRPEQGGLDNREPGSRPETEDGRPTVSANSDVRRGIQRIDEKADRLDRSVEKFESDWQEVPDKVEGAETVMAARGSQFDEVRQTRMGHSARIHALEEQVMNVKLQNNALKGELVRRGDIDERAIGNGYDAMTDQQRHYSTEYPPTPPNPNHAHNRQGLRPDTYEAGYSGDARNPPPGHEQQEVQRGRRVYENDQHGKSHALGVKGADTYWGFNDFYTPEFATSYRREQATMEYAMGKEEEWNRKRREEEEYFLKEKPKTYANTSQYHSLVPPPDVNKYFHDSKYLQERPDTVSDIYTGDTVPFKSIPGTGMTTYEHSFLAPSRGKQAQPTGGLYVIRFNEAGFPDVRLALREQQTVMHSHKGHILGIARAHNVIVLEGEGDWSMARNQTPRAQVSVAHRCVDDAVAMLWFPSLDRATDFCNNSFKNRFRQMDFPTPQSSEIYYINMCTPLYQRELDTFMFVELLNAKRYPAENLQRFEEETRQKMLNFNPNCIPFVVSMVATGREALKRGARGQMFRSQSKLFVSRFSSLSDAAALWQTGIIQNARQDWSLNGPANVYVIALKDFQD